MNTDLTDTKSAVSTQGMLKGQPTLEPQSSEEISASAKAPDTVNTMNKDSQEIQNELVSNKENQATEVTEELGKIQNSTARSNEIIESSRDQISKDEITEAFAEEKIQSTEVNKRQKDGTIDNRAELVVIENEIENCEIDA